MGENLKSGHEHAVDIGFGGKGVGKGGDRFVGKSGVLQGVGGKRVRFDEGKGLFEDDMSLEFHRSIDISADRLRLNCSGVGGSGSIGVRGSIGVGGSGSIGVRGIPEHDVSCEQEDGFYVKTLIIGTRLTLTTSKIQSNR